jgi:uncharacterized protein (AIM24 family)
MPMATTRAAGPETPVPVDDEFLQLLYSGGELLAAGKVIEAKELLERAHQLQPKHEKGQNLLGLTYFKLGLFDRAAELYEMLVRDNPVDPTLRVNLGLVYLKTNALQRAVREFEVAVDLAPDHKKAHNYLGVALAQQSEYGRAREHFLLAGSDAMAEKMSRAIAGEGFSKPPPPQPAKERGFAELEGSEVVREQGGVPVAETPPPLSTEADIEVVEEVPTQQAAPEPPMPPPAPVAVAQPPRPPPPPAEEDWGAQFGLDDAAPPMEAQASPEAPAEAVAEPSAQVAAPEAAQEYLAHAGEPELSGAEGPVMVVAPPVAPPAEEISITVDEVPSTAIVESPPPPPASEDNLPVMAVEEVSEDGMPVLTAEPEDPEDLAAIAQHEQAPAEVPPPAPVMEAAPEAAIPEGSETWVVRESIAPAQPAPEPEALPSPEVAESPASAMVPVSQAQEAAVGFPSDVSPQQGVTPVLGELAVALSLASQLPAGRFNVGPGGFSAVVDGELLTRLEGLVAFSGQLTFQPEMKRFRGRTTDKPFGEAGMRMVRASGRGMLFIEPAERHVFQAVDLGEESAYFRDECVFAFEEPVMFENGRVPSDVAPDLDLVHLRGNGKVLLSLGGPLRSVPVGMEAPVTVPMKHLVGWQGNLTPKVVALLQGPGGEILKTGVELSGEGFALICLPVR